MIKKGDRGPAVVQLQTDLNNIALLPADGIFGDWTDQTVRTFQSSRGLVVDGIVGSATQAALDYELGRSPGPDPSPPIAWKFDLGLYTHKSASDLLSSRADSWLGAARDLGFSRLWIQSNSQGEGHTLSKMGGTLETRASTLSRVCDRVRAFGLVPCLYQWAPRGGQIVDTFTGFDAMPPVQDLCIDLRIENIDWGEEGANLLSASDVAEMRSWLANPAVSPVIHSWNTHAARFAPSMTMLLAPEVDSGTVQAYHSYSADDPDRWWERSQGPRNRQLYANAQVDKVCEARMDALTDSSLDWSSVAGWPRDVAMILALWNQYSASAVPESGYQSHEGAESILAGVEVAREFRYDQLRFWRDEHVAFSWTREAIEEMRHRGWV